MKQVQPQFQIKQIQPQFQIKLIQPQFQIKQIQPQFQIKLIQTQLKRILHQFQIKQIQPQFQMKQVLPQIKQIIPLFQMKQFKAHRNKYTIILLSTQNVNIVFLNNIICFIFLISPSYFNIKLNEDAKLGDNINNFVRLYCIRYNRKIDS